MSVLKMMFGRHAATHYAEKVWPAHDELLNLVEARRGRGKSFGAVVIALEWLKERMDAMLSGHAPHARVYTNNRFDLHRMALHLCVTGVLDNLDRALALVHERIVYITEWDQVLTAYDSLVLMDEANRNLNIYDNQKANQVLMLTVHDWLQQTRKHKLTLYFFVQDVDWVKPQLRSLMDRLWRAKRVRVKGTTRVRYFPWYGSDPFAKGKDGSLNRSADFKMRFDFDVRVARIYDTRQAISTLEQRTQFASFEEIANFMLANNLKPQPTTTRIHRMTWQEEQAWLAASVPAPASRPPSGGGGAGVGVGTVTAVAS